MFNNINALFKRLFNIATVKDIDEIKKLSAHILVRDNNNRVFKSLQDSEFKVFSQWGEDGIIQYLTQKLPIKDKVFIEFGVENYRESNTRLLLENNNWSGLVLDGSKNNIKQIINSDIYWKYDLVAKDVFITKDNIDEVINKYLEETNIKNVGLLSIDLDGNDYYVWDAILSIDPLIVICEYNWIFGNQFSISVPYDNFFERTKKHHSNLFFGASIQALCKLAETKGYSYIGCTTAGNDAFFVKKELALRYIPELVTTPKDSFNEQKAKESRDINGKLTYIRGNERLRLIEHMKVYDFESEKEIKIIDLFPKEML